MKIKDRIMAFKAHFGTIRAMYQHQYFIILPDLVIPAMHLQNKLQQAAHHFLLFMPDGKLMPMSI
jgi:hypothetical protein